MPTRYRLPAPALILSTLLMLVSNTAPAAVPGMTSVGVGQFDQDAVGLHLLWFNRVSTAGESKAWEVRVEHRFGGDLAWTPTGYLTVRPWTGAELTRRRAFFAGAGGVGDLSLGHVVLSFSAGAGLYLQGDGKELGYPLEFRTGLEAGWQFDSGWRLSAGYYHMSNAELREENPGANTLVLYLHLPDNWLE